MSNVRKVENQNTVPAFLQKALGTNQEFFRPEEETGTRYCIEIEGSPFGLHAGPVNTWPTEERAQAVIDYWLTQRTSWAHNVEVEEIVHTRERKGKKTKEIEVVYHYHPKNMKVSAFNG